MEVPGRRGGKWSPKGDVLLVTFDHDLWLLVPGGAPRRLTNDPDDEEASTFSPDGSRVAYVKRSDLFTLERATGVETRLTTTGGEHVFNGKLDWVYEEELARRRISRSYAWAPDSSAIAYLRLDESRVPAFPVVDFAPVNGRVLPQTEKDPRERHVYRTKLDGTGFQRVTEERGSHSLTLSPDGGFFVSSYSNATTPPKTFVRKATGLLVGVLDDTPGLLAGYTLGSIEMDSFRGADGTLFYTRLLKPPDFDPGRKYPAIVFVYGGPHAQEVQDRWGVASGLDHYLASKGFLVWTMDNRGSWGRGHAFETPVLGNMGAEELKDQLEGVAELRKKPFVDAARLGIWGWSYGGYLTLYAVTHTNGTFTCAMAGAPVTDWRLYDSIYTERYMRRPKDNPEGYKTSSPLEAARNLSAKLLVMHGTSDNNVHMQNSIAFIDELVKARKDFVFVPLPRQQHSPRREALLYRNLRLVEWFEKNL